MTIQLLFFIPLCAIAHGQTNAGASMKLDRRIVGGRLAYPGGIPYQVSLQDIRTQHSFCGGVIINELYILTAAHCVNDIDVRGISANVGVTDLRKSHAMHLIESLYMHEDYNPRNSHINDIALLKLKSPLEFSSLVSPVNMTANQTVQAGSTATVSGYGLLRHRGMRTKQLHVVDIKIADQTYCKKVYKQNSIMIYDTQICAYVPTAEKGSCQGDSGGPLTVNGNLIGLVSWGSDCANLIYPTVYTRVSPYVQWITKHIV